MYKIGKTIIKKHKAKNINYISFIKNLPIKIIYDSLKPGVLKLCDTELRCAVPHQK